MDTILNALKSKTIWGLIIATIGSTTVGSDIVNSFGVNEENAVTFVDSIIQAVGTLLAIYGRVVAKKPLK